MPDPQTVTAVASGTAAVIVAVTGLLSELRRWRRRREAETEEAGNGR